MSDLSRDDLLALVRKRIQEYQRLYRLAHREKARAATREYYREHREEILTRRRECYRRDREKNKGYYQRNREKTRAYYHQNLARIKAVQDKYRAKNREKINARTRQWHQNQTALAVAGQMRSLATLLQQRLKGKTMVVEANPNTVPGLLEALNTVATMSDPEELRRSIVEHLNHLVLDFIQLAALVKRCNDLGIELADMQIPILPYLRRLACGQLLPEVLVQFHSRPWHLRRIAALPLPDQDKIVHGQPCTLMLANGDRRAVPATLLNGNELSQVFGPDGIRDEAEQAAWLREKTQRRPPLAPGDVEMDYRQGLVHIVGEKWLNAEELSHLVSLLVSHHPTRQRRASIQPIPQR